MRGHLHSVSARPSRGAPRARLIRVVLADGHDALRRSLRHVLEREPDLEVIAEASDFETTTSRVFSHRPQVLVVDVRMADGPSSEAIQRLRNQAPRTEIVVITMNETQPFVDQALKSGALGIVLKDTADTELPDAVRHAARGLQYVSPRVGTSVRSEQVKRPRTRER